MGARLFRERLGVLSPSNPSAGGDHEKGEEAGEQTGRRTSLFAEPDRGVVKEEAGDRKGPVEGVTESSSPASTRARKPVASRRW